MKVFYFFITLLISGICFIFWQHFQLTQDEIVLSKPSPTIFVENNAVISAIETDNSLDKNTVALGKRLFFDKQLSADNSIACVNCHQLNLGGTDQLARSVGIKGAIGNINAPTVFNSGLNFKQFWDGRAETLEEQVNGPLHSPIEMGSDWKTVIAKLNRNIEYQTLFANVYNDGITANNIRDAIATFERSLTTPNSRFDKFLKGDKTALTALEQSGYQRFKDFGCVSCHQGVNMGGNMFQIFGVMGDYFADRGNVTETDWGRYNVTGREEDKYFFKVPSLRNVAETPPYFHDGSAQNLDDAVKVMLKYQLGRVFSDEDIQALVAFLRTLTGEYNGQAL